MKRRFRSESDLEKAAQRRGFSLPPAKAAPTPVAPAPAPPPPAPIQLAPSVEPSVVEGAMQLVSRAAADAVAQASVQNERVVAALERRLTEISAAAGRPLRWRVRVAERDRQGRIEELIIDADDS